MHAETVMMRRNKGIGGRETGFTGGHGEGFAFRPTDP